MTDPPSSASVPAPPEEKFPVALVRPARWSFREWIGRTWFLWAITFGSLAITAVLVFVSAGASGPLITVRFSEGHGIKPGDRLRHRGIEVGEVVKVDLAPELEGVLLTLELTPAAQAIAREGSRFWIERPQISLTRLSGLETVVGGKYVGVLPGPEEAKPVFEFEGMDSPPLLHDAEMLEITVRFQNGYGLTAGDLVKHRGILIGEVTSVQLDPEFQGVEVRVRLVGRATGLARTGSQFWVERPRLSIAEVRGLETLVGGRYLAVLPGPLDGEPRRSFIGMESAPAGELPEGGLEILLQGSVRHGLERGAPVTYRGHHVGHVISVGLARDAASVDARAYVGPDYRSLVRGNTRFWSNSGLHVSLGISGLQLSTDTLTSLTVGGVSLATPTEPGKPVATGHRFEIADEPESDWLEWEPRIAVGAGVLRGGLPLPSPLRASLRWPESFLGISRTKRLPGWVLSIDQGRRLLGPADLLTPREDADDQTILEVSGRELVIVQERSLVINGLAVYEVEGDPIAPESAWPIDRLRQPSELESALLIADPQTATLPLPVERLSSGEAGWLVDPSVPLDAAWHGGCLVSVNDGQVIGIALASERPARIVLIPKQKIIP